MDMVMHMATLQTADNSVWKPILPDWTRWAWASLIEREWWSPIFTAVSNGWHEVERLSVVEGVRSAARTNVDDAEEFLNAFQWAREHGIICIPIARVPKINNYSSISVPSASAQNGPVDYGYQILYVHPDRYKDAYDLSTNDEKLGELLGYPTCCREAFKQTWGKGQVDSTWEQSLEGTQPNGPVESTTIRRWMGIRYVSHMPCTHNCGASVEIGKRMYDVGMKYGLTEEMLAIREILNWPVKWSRLFGIAEIMSPALKISTRSDWTPYKQSFERQGVYMKPQKTWWTDNGFNSAAGMRQAHKEMIETLYHKLPKNARVLDLGCGNGMLLRRLTIYRPDIRIAGVDSNAAAIQNAQQPIDLRSKFWADTIQHGAWRDWNATAVLYNPARLLEMSSADAQRVREWVNKIPVQFPYVYGDWQQKTGLSTLCETTQLSAPIILSTSPNLEVGMIQAQT
jgi:hypothetical protein